jgi:hypothetical protein
LWVQWDFCSIEQPLRGNPWCSSAVMGMTDSCTLSYHLDEL